MKGSEGGGGGVEEGREKRRLWEGRIWIHEEDTEGIKGSMPKRSRKYKEVRKMQN